VGAGRAGILRGSAPLSRPRPHDHELAGLRETIADVERRLQAALADGGRELHAEIVRQQRQAEELARVARLVNETLDLPTVSERIADSVLGMLRVTSSAIRLIQPDGSLKAIALGGRAKEYAANRETVPAGVGLVGRAAARGARCGRRTRGPTAASRRVLSSANGMPRPGSSPGSRCRCA
jgi:hypothetical protein